MLPQGLMSRKDFSWVLRLVKRWLKSLCPFQYETPTALVAQVKLRELESSVSNLCEILDTFQVWLKALEARSKRTDRAPWQTSSEQGVAR